MTAFDYTSRDYTSIQNDLLDRATRVLPEWTSRDASDFGMVLVDLWSYMGDILHYYVDRAAGESNLQTATQRESVLSIASLLDYIPSGRIPSRGIVSIDATATTVTDAQPLIIPQYWRFIANPQQANASYVIFTLDNAIAINQSGTTYTDGNGVTYTTYAKTTTPINLSVTEGERFEEYFTATGLAGQRIKLTNTGVVNASLSVDVAEGTNGAYVAYSYVDRLLDATNSQRVFTTELDSNDNMTLVFGNGINGALPLPNAQIKVTYRRSRGSAGNLPAYSIKGFDQTTLTDGTPLAGITVLGNTSATSGGSDAESMASMKVNIPLSFRTQDRAVSLSDYKDLSLRVPGVVKASAVLNTGVVTVYHLPQQGDYASRTTAQNNITVSGTALATSLYNYLSVRTIAGVNFVLSSSVALFPVYITVAVHVLNGYIREKVVTEVKEAIADLFSFDNIDFSKSISLGDLYRAIIEVRGVDYATVSQMTTVGGSMGANLIDGDDTFRGISGSAMYLPYIASNAQPTINASGGIVGSV